MRDPTRFVVIAVGVLIFLTAHAARVPAQSYRHAGTEFEAIRRVMVPADASPTVVVTEFHHHGLVDDDGKNLLVVSGGRNPMPTRLLQLGPGDFCRVAFQTDPRQREYLLYYGGDPPNADLLPEWTNQNGLLLETREYAQCNLNSFDSVKQAFDSARPIGSDYVDAVKHGSNPFTLTPAPFLSRYSGTMRIAGGGKYGFLTSSQDCSFLLIDGEVVVSAPGRHGPARRAFRGTRQDIRLEPGQHKFEYYHAATGPTAWMVAAWELNPRNPKPAAPVAIPTSVFRADSIAHVPAGPPETQSEKLLPFFVYKIDGSVPLPDNPRHLVSVQFANYSPPALLTRSKMQWDFGDGQTSDQPSPEHVYLRPGLYTVTLAIQRGLKRVEMTNVLQIDQRQDRPKKPHEIDRYLPIVEMYDPAKLDAESLEQLVLAYLWKADLIVNPKEEDEKNKPEEESAAEASDDPGEAARQLAERKALAREFLVRAVDAAQVAFLGPSAAEGDEPLFRLAKLAAPIARDQLGDSLSAGKIWHGASQRISRPEYRAECQLHAADIALNDLANPQGAKPLLDQATKALGQAQTGEVASCMRRIWGDYHAATGDQDQARQNYRDAEEVRAGNRGYAEQTAWRGAYSRSTEQFLKSGEYDRAAQQLRVWQQEFPSERLDGYLHLLFARYWAGRKNYAAAIAQSSHIDVVNPYSPYADQLLLLAAECEEKQGRIDRAVAKLQSLLADYPGSPLVSQVREEIKRLEAELNK